MRHRGIDRMLKHSKYLLFFLSGLVLGCSPSTVPSNTTNSYEEDLSAHRPSGGGETVVVEEPIELPEREDIPYVEPTNHLKAEIDSIIRIKSARNQDLGYLQGFTIQIYSGRSREDANNAKYAVYEILEDEDPFVFYDQPRFRVKVGKYYSRLEAEKSLNLLKTRFRQALILPERIPLSEE